MNRNRTVAALLASGALSACLLATTTGCVSHSQLMVNPAGQTIICQSAGYGLIGATMANRVRDDCQAAARAGGYRPVEEVGVVGVQLDEACRVLSVVKGGPADLAGIRAGEVVTAIDGVLVGRRDDAMVLLIGQVGGAVTVSIEGRDIKLVRVAWPSLYGAPGGKAGQAADRPL